MRARVTVDGKAPWKLIRRAGVDEQDWLACRSHLRYVGIVQIPVTLRSWPGGPVTDGTATAEWPPTATRVVSALKLIGLGAVVAVVLLPVPIIHLAGIGFFVACLGVGAMRLRPGARLRAVSGPCPHCGHEQGYWIGVNLGPAKLPKETSCEKCAKSLSIEGELKVN